MAKDYKAECDELRGQIKELRALVERYRSNEEYRIHRDQDVRDKFKELLLDVLGR